MAIADGKVSLKHLVTMETLTNEEVLGLIRRGGDFKNGRAVSGVRASNEDLPCFTQYDITEFRLYFYS